MLKNDKHPVYLDCNATTPMEPEVAEVLMHYHLAEFGNAGSRTHAFGTRAKQAAQRARQQVAAVVGARKDEVIFTSGATESNNLGLLGLAELGLEEGRTHIITTAIEHKAVLEPIELLEKRGFEVTRLAVGAEGWVQPAAVDQALRPETLMVSIMQANNETGILQPITEIAEVLRGHNAIFHTDAAQGYGKDLAPLRHSRVDMISMSGHKIFGPKGIGALIVRKRGYKRIPLQPLMVGGGQERGMRPGTLPVGLVVALGVAAELAVRDHGARQKRCREIRDKALKALDTLSPKYTGDQESVMPHVLNLSIGNLDSEALIVATKSIVAISNGSACTSSTYSPSHVLLGMGHAKNEANRCIRMSWSHLTPDVDWGALNKTIKSLTDSKPK